MPTDLGCFLFFASCLLRSGLLSSDEDDPLSSSDDDSDDSLLLWSAELLDSDGDRRWRLRRFSRLLRDLRLDFDACFFFFSLLFRWCFATTGDSDLARFLELFFFLGTGLLLLLFFFLLFC